MAHRVLIVDDEIDLLEILAFNLSKAGFEVSTATSGDEALVRIVAGEMPSVVLLDVMMSGRDGYDTARSLRARGVGVPILFLTARDTEADLLEGFDAGGDDYIAKPFSVREVVARVRAAAARVPEPTARLEFDRIAVDPSSKTASVGGAPVALTKTEYGILAVLIAKPEKLFSRDELLDTVWGREVYVEPRTVDVHIARLRKKLGPEAGAHIVNRSGYGYCLTSKTE